MRIKVLIDMEIHEISTVKVSRDWGKTIAVLQLIEINPGFTEISCLIYIIGFLLSVKSDNKLINNLTFVAKLVLTNSLRPWRNNRGWVLQVAHDNSWYGKPKKRKLIYKKNKETYMKLLTICFVSSVILVFAKLIQEARRAANEHHFNRIIKPHMLKSIPRTFMYSGSESSPETGTDWGSTGLNLEVRILYGKLIQNKIYLPNYLIRTPRIIRSLHIYRLRRMTK